MFVKSTFCINRKKFYYFLKLKVLPWAYVSQKVFGQFQNHGSDEPLIIWIKLDSWDTPDFFGICGIHVSLFCVV